MKKARRCKLCGCEKGLRKAGRYLLCGDCLTHRPWRKVPNENLARRREADASRV
jgi:hypothetical protein